MQIKGTSKIKGSLTLSKLNHQLAKNQSLYISDDNFYDNELQIAIKMGLVSVIDAPNKEAAFAAQDRIVRCRNNFFREISVLGRNIKGNQEFLIKESELSDPHVRSAVARGTIAVLGTAETNTNYSEGSLKINLKPKTEPTETSNEQNEQIEQPKVKLDTNEELPTMKKTVDSVKNESAKRVVEIDISQIEENRVDSPDPLKNTIVWNPNKQKTKQVDAIESGPKVTSKPKTEKDPKGKSVIWNPGAEKIIKQADEVIKWNEKPKNRAKTANKHVDLEFVDQISVDEKIKNHPILSKVEQLPPEEPVIPDDTNAKIAKHPILSKKLENNAEIE